MKIKRHIIKTNREYRESLYRAARLRDSGARAETCEILAALEAAISRYSLIPGKPARSKGRPGDR